MSYEQRNETKQPAGTWFDKSTGLLFDDDPHSIEALTCGRCFGIHADHQCPNDS